MNPLRSRHRPLSGQCGNCPAIYDARLESRAWPGLCPVCAALEQDRADRRAHHVNPCVLVLLCDQLLNAARAVRVDQAVDRGPAIALQQLEAAIAGLAQQRARLREVSAHHTLPACTCPHKLPLHRFAFAGADDALAGRFGLYCNVDGCPCGAAALRIPLRGGVR